MDADWDPIPIKPFSDKYFSNATVEALWSQVGKRVLQKDICHYQDDLLTISGWLQQGEVDGKHFVWLKTGDPRVLGPGVAYIWPGYIVHNVDTSLLSPGPSLANSISALPTQ